MIHPVYFRRENVTVHVADGANLRQVCLQNGIDPYPVLGGLLSCRGKGFCGTCLVEVDDPQKLSAPTKREARWLSRHRPGHPTLRLACQAEVHGQVIVTTDPDLKPGWQSHTYYSGRVERPWEQVKKEAAPQTPESAS